MDLRISIGESHFKQPLQFASQELFLIAAFVLDNVAYFLHQLVTNNKVLLSANSQISPGKIGNRFEKF